MNDYRQEDVRHRVSNVLKESGHTDWKLLWDVPTSPLLRLPTHHNKIAENHSGSFSLRHQVSSRRPRLDTRA